MGDFAMLLLAFGGAIYAVLIGAAIWPILRRRADRRHETMRAEARRRLHG